MIRELIDSELEVVAGGFTINGNGNDPVNINFNPVNNSPGGNATGGNGGGQNFGHTSFD